MKGLDVEVEDLIKVYRVGRVKVQALARALLSPWINVFVRIKSRIRIWGSTKIGATSSEVLERKF